ncbi:MAG: tight adherence protein, partial [Nocardioidaceae bacterium]|nr:tight adherence protein [Nocardioidaceae bacterium]
MRTVGRFLALLLLGGTVLAGAASAQTPAASDERLVLRAVDASNRDEVKLVVSWSGAASALDDLTVSAGGEQADVTNEPFVDSGYTHDIFVVVDTSASTDNDAMLTEARQALTGFFETVPPGTQMSLIRAGASAQSMQALTADPAELIDHVADLAPSGESGLLGGVTRAAASGGSVDDAITTIVLITNGVTEPTVSGAQARSALADAGATLYVIGLQSGGLDEGSFSSLAGATGGRLVVTDDPTELSGVLEGLAPEIEQLGVATFPSVAERGIEDLVVTADSTSTAGSYVIGGTLEGPQRLTPRPVVDAGGFRFLQNETAKYLAMAAGTLAVFLFAYGVILLFVRQDGDLSVALRPYGEGFVAAGEEDAEGGQQLAQTAFLQRAVAMTESCAQRQGLLVR